MDNANGISRTVCNPTTAKTELIPSFKYFSTRVRQIPQSGVLTRRSHPLRPQPRTDRTTPESICSHITTFTIYHLKIYFENPNYFSSRFESLSATKRVQSLEQRRSDREGCSEKWPNEREGREKRSLEQALQSLLRQCYSLKHTHTHTHTCRTGSFT